MKPSGHLVYEGNCHNDPRTKWLFSCTDMVFHPDEGLLQTQAKKAESFSAAPVSPVSEFELTRVECIISWLLSECKSRASGVDNMHAEKHGICHPCSALQREVRVRGWFLWQAQCRWHKTDVAARGTELIQHSRLDVWSVSSSPQLGWKIKPCRQLSNFYIFGNKKSSPQKMVLLPAASIYKWVRFQVFFFPPWFFWGQRNPHPNPERSSHRPTSWGVCWW